MVGGVVASALLPTAVYEFAVVQDVGEHQVNAKRVVCHAELVSDAAVEHEAAVSLGLLGNNEVAVVIHCTAADERALVAK